jgi:N-acetylmuramoyl-L-alanine amidase
MAWKFPVANQVRRAVAMRVLTGIWACLTLGACVHVHEKPAVRKTSRTFTTVVIDPGHGGHDSGARARNGLLEKNLALDIALRLEPKLRAAGFRTVLTRRSDVFIELNRRSYISGQYENAVFVSIHLNDCRRRAVWGVESYYFSEESKRMSHLLVHTLAAGIQSPDRGPRVARFRVLRTNENPAVLMECGYMSSPRESALLSNAGYRERIAECLAGGIIAQRGGPLLRPHAE